MISRLMLGTANFGLDDYPPGRGHQRVPRDEAIAINEHAYRAGIRAFDTAWAYGDGLAEDILAEALGGRPAHVTTKRRVGDTSPVLHPWIVLQHNPTVDQMDATFDGASVYTVEEASTAVECRHRHIQVPYWLMNPWCRFMLDYRGVTTYARQPYGRGQLPERSALVFALSSPADYIVFGARSVTQLDETLRWATMPLPDVELRSVCTGR